MVAKPYYLRLFQPPHDSFFLFGVRGSGKSTWARQFFPHAHVLNLLDEELHHALLLNPGQFAAELRTVPPDSWVVVDEVQRIPSLLNEVHRFLEQARLRFVLLGSSARKLKTAGTNLLAGRAVHKTLYPFTPEELGADFVLDDVLRYGSIPLVWQSSTRQDTVQSYVQLYLREEIRAEALVRNLPGFTRFLPIASLFHGQTLNVQSLARDAGVARTTANGYLDILEDTLLTFRLLPFEGKLRVRERKHPKLYWIDPGLVRAVKRQFGPLSPEERGALLEGWIAVLLRMYGEYRQLYEECWYWSPTESRGNEVDFLLRRGREYLAIERVSVGRHELGGRQCRGIDDSLKRITDDGQTRTATATKLETERVRASTGRAGWFRVQRHAALATKQGIYWVLMPAYRLLKCCLQKNDRLEFLVSVR